MNLSSEKAWLIFQRFTTKEHLHALDGSFFRYTTITQFWGLTVWTDEGPWIPMMEVV